MSSSRSTPSVGVQVDSTSKGTHQTSPASSRPHESCSSPPDYPFYRDAQGNPAKPSAITLVPMTHDEADEFLGLPDTSDLVKIMETIDAAREEHRKDQPISQRKRLNGALLAASAPIALQMLEMLYGAERPSPDQDLTQAQSSSTQSVKGRGAARDSDLGHFRSESSREVPRGESELSLQYQAGSRLEAIFYEILSNEIGHQFRAILPAEFFETREVSQALSPVFREDRASARALDHTPFIPTTLADARKCLGISKDAICADVTKRWKSFQTGPKYPNKSTIGRVIGSIVLLSAHDSNGLNISSTLLHTVLNYESQQATRRVLNEAGIASSTIDDVIKSSLRASAKLNLESEHVDEVKALREEVSSLKKKRNEDLVIIEGLRKEVEKLQLKGRGRRS